MTGRAMKLRVMKGSMPRLTPRAKAASLARSRASVDVLQGVVAHDAGNGKDQLGRDGAALRDHDAAPVLHHPVGRQGHLLLAGAHHDDVVGVVGDAGGHGSGLQPVPLEIADADVAGVLVPLDDGDLQNVLLRVDPVGVALVLGDDLSGHQTDDAPGPVVLEILAGEMGEMEGVMGLFTR